ncbi:MAG: VWA domain-containing protein [Anaerolineae bacterium]
MSIRRTWLVLVLLGALLLGLNACNTPADASKSASRDQINSGQIVPAEQLRVAEYLNYYKQSFPAPVNTTLGLDLRMGNQQAPAQGGEAWLQIGIQARTGETEQIAPLNVALVIDKSGSMDAPEKMPYLKKSLKYFLHSLAPNDRVAIVAFSDNASVIAPSQPVGDGRWIDATVENIQPGGSTNLYGGLMLGFQEVDRNFDVRLNNRVILLTDGIANVGATDPTQIADGARSYNEKGIYLSTIGLGHDFNDALLSQLARQGKGGYHFVDSAAEMDKIFRQEVNGLVQKAVSDVSVVIQPASSVTVDSITGYDSRPPSGPLTVKLQDMGTGDSQVILAHLYISSGAPGQRQVATIELHYRDLFKQRDETVSQTIVVDVTRAGGNDPLWDTEVLRNVTIQQTAEGLKEIDRLYQSQRYQEAWNLAYQLEQQLRRVAGLTHEDQMYKDADMMRTYENTLARWVQNQTGRLPQAPEGGPTEPAGQAPRMRLPTLTPDASIIEVR